MPGSFEKEPGQSKTGGQSVSIKPLNEKNAKGKGRMPFEYESEEKHNDQDHLEKEKHLGVEWDEP